MNSHKLPDYNTNREEAMQFIINSAEITDGGKPPKKQPAAGDNGGDGGATPMDIGNINKGGKNAARCIELASGAEHTDEELKATKKSEINPECPALANPNYVHYE